LFQIHGVVEERTDATALPAAGTQEVVVAVDQAVGDQGLIGDVGVAFSVGLFIEQPVRAAVAAASSAICIEARINALSNGGRVAGTEEGFVEERVRRVTKLLAMVEVKLHQHCRTCGVKLVVDFGIGL
jgi:hypothetical protein